MNYNVNKSTPFNLFSTKNDLKRTFSRKNESQKLSILDKENELNYTEKVNEKSNIFQEKRFKALEKFKNSISNNLYEILNISPTSSQEEIKKAYKKLSLKHHPDKNTTGNKEKFHMIIYAYKILGNEELRRIYDEQGLEFMDEVLNIYEGNNFPLEINV